LFEFLMLLSYNAICVLKISLKQKQIANIKKTLKSQEFKAPRHFKF